MISLSLVAAAALVGLLLYKFSPNHHIAHLPAVPLRRTVLAMLKKLPFDDVLEYTTQLSLLHRYKVVRAYFQGQWTVMVGCPSLAQKIYNDTDAFPKLVPEQHQPGTIFARLTGHSAFFANADEWRTHRKSLLHPAAFTSYVQNRSTLSTPTLSTIMANLHASLSLQPGTPIDALDAMQRVTFDCLSTQFLGRNFNLTQSSNALAKSMLDMFDSAFTYGFTLMTTLFPALQSIHNPFYKHVYRDVEQWESCLQQIINSTRKTIELEGAPKETDLVTRMVLASKQAYASVQEADTAILNNLKMLFLPSQSLPPALGAALHFLAQDAAVQQRAYSEVKEVVGECTGFALGQSQLGAMPYLAAIVKETLRLYPTLCPPPKRIASRDVTLGEHFIPKGTHLMIDTFAIQRDPILWSDPTKFDPTRFVNNAPTISQGYLPFAAGSRRCPGSQLVQDLMTNILANVIAGYRVQYPSPKEPVDRPRFQLKLKLKLKAQVILIPDNLLLTFTPRKDKLQID